MPTWQTTPQAVAILSRIKPDDLCVISFSPIVGPSYLKLVPDNLDTGDQLEVLETVRHRFVNEAFGMTFSEAQEAGQGREWLAAYNVAPDASTVLAERFGDPAKFGGTNPDTATLLWRLEANEARKMGEVA